MRIETHLDLDPHMQRFILGILHPSLPIEIKEVKQKKLSAVQLHRRLVEPHRLISGHMLDDIPENKTNHKMRALTL